ncbi:Uncharacterised protein [Zhongshania aliphaticivorans]|uniref:PilZ domain-containing protein n=1 Tax=Zhongshania aliphaticivorans TaxID=1470434 RepID=A0A5S9Q7K0_9GAMM|nr:hypothetical protein [Zhongshania aliphaticivorans]CAA0102768.1 Uncharacterised protein [Zhongshania aliphaticivorans]CAA0113917.1 Uncharacterised protein [Zhongshania aliphaticivorans]
MTTKINNLRRFFRLPYPKAAQPPLQIDKDTAYRILEISELGIILAYKPEAPLTLGEKISGNILFHDQDSEEVEGEVYRLDTRGVVIQLSKGVSARHMMKQQVFVKNAFPVFFRYTVKENISSDK